MQLDRQTSRSNARVFVLCSLLVASMLGMAYAAVPLYRIFCQVTGFGGTTQRAEAPASRVLDRTIKVRFDSNVSSQLNWDFKPAQLEAEMKVGEQTLVFYKAANRSDRPLTGTATFNVSPPRAGAYFSKVECFCFTEQTLQPGESIDMPVVFFIDPDIDDDIDLRELGTITLSYTFYAVDKPLKTSAVAAQKLN